MASGAFQGVVRTALLLHPLQMFVMPGSRGWFRPGCDGGTMAAAEYEE
jgi:hypothetical protein